MDIISYIVPAPGQALGLLAILATLLLFALFGSHIGGRTRVSAADPFVGCGMVTGAFTIIGVFSGIPFTWVFYGAWAGALLAAVHLVRRRPEDTHNIADVGRLWRVLVVAGPLLILVSAMRASQWDEFSQWLPNALYLLRHDGFPATDMPPSPSSYAGYPYGLPLINYLASRLAGEFIENAGALSNIILVVLFAPLYLEMVRKGLKAGESWRQGWGAAGLGVLGVTILSTTFVQKLSLTAYADTATGVVLGVLGVLVWKMLEVLTNDQDDHAQAQALAWQIGFVAAFFLILKQANLVLLVLLLGGAGLAALRDPDIRVSGYFRCLPAILAPAAVVYLSWRYHLATELPGREFGIMARELWLVDDTFLILARMAQAAAKKGPYFAMMVLVSAFGLRAVWRCRGGFDRYALMVGAIFVGYNLFLWLMYVIAFGVYEGRNVASFWRYNTQLGILGSSCAAFGLAILWRQHVAPRLIDGPTVGRRLAALAVILVLVAPLAAAKKLRVDIRPQKDHVRSVAKELAGTLPRGARLGVVDLNGSGFEGIVMRYELLSGPGAGRGLAVGPMISAFDGLKSPAVLNARLDKAAVTHAWVHQNLPVVRAAMNVEMKAGYSHLLRRDGRSWSLVKSWPYQGYDDPHDPRLPD